MTDWMDISSAPKDGTEFRVRTEGGLEFDIKWMDGLVVDEQDHECGGWFAVNEDEMPDCWTDGICWSENADGRESDQPMLWQPA